MSRKDLKGLIPEGGLKHREAQLQPEKQVVEKGEGEGFLLFPE